MILLHAGDSVVLSVPPERICRFNPCKKSACFTSQAERCAVSYKCKPIFFGVDGRRLNCRGTYLTSIFLCLKKKKENKEFRPHWFEKYQIIYKSKPQHIHVQTTYTILSFCMQASWQWQQSMHVASIHALKKHVKLISQLAVWVMLTVNQRLFPRLNEYWTNA